MCLLQILNLKLQKKMERNPGKSRFYFFDLTTKKNINISTMSLILFHKNKVDRTFSMIAKKTILYLLFVLLCF